MLSLGKLRCILVNTLALGINKVPIVIEKFAVEDISEHLLKILVGYFAKYRTK